MSLGRYGLPNEVLFCKKCVISNQRPSSTIEFSSKKGDPKTTIFFDSEGVCDACNFNEKKNHEINWEAREKQLFKLAEKLDSHPGYNIVVPGSGGKDSAFTAHILKYKYGFRPLTVTWAPHLYTDIGWKNFEAWTHVGGLDNILFTPNGLLHRELTRRSFINLLHPFQPFIIGQRIIGPLVAMKFGIPVVFYGENQAEYGNSSVENNSPFMDAKFFSSRNTAPRFGGDELAQIVSETKFSRDDFAPYLPPSQDDLAKASVQVHYLGYYIKWDPQECFYYAVENTGFSPSPTRTEGSYSKYSSLDDKIDPFHYYTTLAKFGLGRASYDAAQEIRNGKITRDEGVGLVKKFDLEFPEKYFQEFLNYIKISEDAFHEIVDSFRSPHLWKRVNGEWHLKRPIWEE